MKIIRVQKKVDRAGILDALAKAAIYVAWAEDRELKGKTFTPDEKVDIKQRIKEIEKYLEKIKDVVK